MPKRLSTRIWLTKLLGSWAGLIQGDTLTWDRWRWLADRLPATRNGERLLDVGCGTGAFTICAALRGYEALGLTWDEGDSEVAIARSMIIGAKGATFSICDVRELEKRIEFRSQFEVAICCENIEHILDDFRLVRAIYMTLKPGGRLLLTTPNYLNRPISAYDMGPFQKSEEGWHVRRGYTPTMLREVVTRAGFVVEEISYCSGFFSQKFTYFLRLFPGRLYYFAWILTACVRPIIPIADHCFHLVISYPKYSIGITAYKERSY